MEREDKNYVSVGFWMLAMLVTAIPVIGWIMIFVWAFTGDNESRKNYFRAILAWFAGFVALFVILALVGQLPHIQKQLPHLLPPNRRLTRLQALSSTISLARGIDIPK